MSNQDSDFFQEEENTAIDATSLNLLAMLHLNSTAATTPNAGDRQPPNVTTTAAPLFSTNSIDNQYTKSGKSTKRQSPSSLSSLQEPSSKRAALLPPSSSATTFSGGHHRILGFTKLKLPLPHTFSSASSPSSSSSPAIRRTISDPINSPGCDQLQAPPNTHGNFFNHQLPESSAINSAATSPSQPLYRSISDPVSASYQVVTTTSTPPRPPVARKVMRSPKSIAQIGQNLKDESPNTKRLKRMKDRLREMSQWWNEVIEESEKDNGSDSEDNDNLPKDDSEVSQVTENEGPCEEAVWVERNGECLILHFKCPCGKGYQILLSGKNCYYKLTAF